jgi:hypothetical protein
VFEGLATLSMDEAYVRERAIQTRQKHTYDGVGEGISRGFRDFGIGLSKGIIGLLVFLSIFIDLIQILLINIH